MPSADSEQRVSSPFAPAFHEVPCFDEAVHHLADTPLRDAEPAGEVLAGDHRVVGDEVQCPLLRRADAEGRLQTAPSARDGGSDARFRSGEWVRGPSAALAVSGHGPPEGST